MNPHIVVGCRSGREMVNMKHAQIGISRGTFQIHCFTVHNDYKMTFFFTAQIGKLTFPLLSDLFIGDSKSYLSGLPRLRKNV